MKLLNVHEYGIAAQACLDRAVWDYYQGGSDDEVTLQTSRQAFERLRLRPRMLVNTSNCNLQTYVLGTPVSMPILVFAPRLYSLLTF
jgi:4-hydroxymandelate oxidase